MEVGAADSVFGFLCSRVLSQREMVSSFWPVATCSKRVHAINVQQYRLWARAEVCREFSSYDRQ